MENISKNFSNDNVKQTGVNGYLYDFLVDYGIIDVDDILDIYKYLMNKLAQQKLLQQKLFQQKLFQQNLTKVSIFY